MTPAALLHLPVELFRAILAACIRVRGIRRAFRLRLVNHFWASELIHVINESHLLDDCPIRMNKMGKVGINYMSRRLLNPKLPVSPTWDGIRRIAMRLATEDHNNLTDYETYIGLLCTRASYGKYAQYTMAAMCMGRLGPDDMPDDGYSEQEYNYDLMAAAAYTNNLTIIEELGANPTTLGITAGAFGHPYLTAVIGGNTTALDLLLQKRHDCSHSRFERSVSENVDGVKRTILSSVALHGTPSMVRRCLPKWHPFHFTKWCKYRLEQLGNALTTPYVETFNMIMRERGTTPDADLSAEQLVGALDRACWHGWQEMAQHLISLGALVRGDGQPSRHYRPLKSASQGGFEGIVQMLLDHGAGMEGDEIGEAAKKGRWDVVRMLIAHGVDFDQGEPPPVVSAVWFERKDIVLELMEKGAVLEGEIGAKAVEVAKEDGLDSMLLFMEELGVGVSSITKLE